MRTSGRTLGRRSTSSPPPSAVAEGSTSAGAVGRGGTRTVRTQAFRSATRLRRRPRRCTSTRTHVAVRSPAATSSAIRLCLSWSAGTSTAITARVRCGRLHCRYRTAWATRTPASTSGARTRSARTPAVASTSLPVPERFGGSRSKVLRHPRRAQLRRLRPRPHRLPVGLLHRHRLRLSRQRSVACLGSSACASSPRRREFEGRDAGSDGSDASSPSVGGASSSRSHLAQPAGGSAGRVCTSR